MGGFAHELACTTTIHARADRGDAPAGARMSDEPVIEEPNLDAAARRLGLNRRSLDPPLQPSSQGDGVAVGQPIADDRTARPGQGQMSVAESVGQSSTRFEAKHQRASIRSKQKPRKLGRKHHETHASDIVGSYNPMNEKARGEKIMTPARDSKSASVRSSQKTLESRTSEIHGASNKACGLAAVGCYLCGCCS